MNYIGQIFGNREVIKNDCTPEDWENVGMKQPKSTSKYVLTRCLNCGKVLPAQIGNLKFQAPKRCMFCSNQGNAFGIKTDTNTWAVYEDYAVCNIVYNKITVQCFVDIEDYETVSKRVWRVAQKSRKYYALTGCIKKNNVVYMHDLIYKHDKNGLEIDHIDGNSLNNRKNNLRLVSHQDNIDNLRATRIDNTIGIRGIVYSKRDKTYKVDFNYHGKRLYSKEWNTIEEAVWFRYCLEDYFGLPAIKNNPIAKEYFTLNEKMKNEIQEYALLKIKNTWKQAV